MVTSSPGYHYDRRQFLRLQLYQTYELLREKPAMIVPKLSLVLASLSMAKEEILWYFRHTEKPSPKSSKGIRSPPDFSFKDDSFSPAFSFLLFSISQIQG